MREAPGVLEAEVPSTVAVRERWQKLMESKAEDPQPNGHADPAETQATTTFEPNVAIGVPAVPACGRAVLVKSSDVAAEAVEWLWPGRLPIGMLSLVFGDGGVGKSQLTMAVAAHVTKGLEWPDQPGRRAQLGSVLVIQAEDSLAHTVRPRIDAAGADPSRVIMLTGVKREGAPGESGFQLAAHMDALRAAVKRIDNLRLVVIDPISAFLGGTDECKNAEVRTILAPLAAMAEHHRFSVLMVHHVNKGTGTKAMYRASGSLAFVNAARIAWYVCADPHKPGRCYMAPVKCNICAMPSAMAFTNGENAIKFESEPIEGLHANSILAQERAKLMEDEGARDGERGPVPKKIRACEKLIADLLSAGPRPRREASAETERAGFKPGTFYEALRRGPFETYPQAGEHWLRLIDGLPLESPETAEI